jgi:adenine-specific DNA-methyltransferase
MTSTLAAPNRLVARDLGARGSRAEIGQGDPAVALPPAAAAVVAAVPAWWEACARSAGLRGRWLDVSRAVDAPPPARIGQPTTNAQWRSWSATELGAAYVAALTPEVRARHGRHYTPSNLAEHLWAMARKGLDHRQPARALAGLVRDPACGAGSLLLPALREHLRAMVRADARVVLAGLPNVIEGVDADPTAVWIANVVLAAEALPVLAGVPIARRRPLPALARVGDGLSPAPVPARVILMNPPYGRVRLTPDDRERFASILYGHANLYGMFLGAGLESLDHAGVLAALVPTSFTAGRYFSGLRGELSRIAPLRDATFMAVRDGVFAGVLQETCLAVFTKRRPRRTTIASMNGHVSAVARVKSPRGCAPWLLPRRADDAHIAAAALAMPLTLAGAGWRVSTGPLVWNRRREDLSSQPGAGRLRVVWAADFDNGRLHRDRARDTLRYLRVRDEVDEQVMSLATPAVLVQRTTAPEQRRRVVVTALTRDDLENQGGAVVVENHVNVLRPRRATARPLLSHSTLAAVLATQTIDQLARCVSGSVALSAYELESLPLPRADVLRTWETLSGGDLKRAVADAYRPVAL